MHRWFRLLLLPLLLVACSEESTPGVTPPVPGAVTPGTGARPSAVPSSNVTVDDLDGSWVFGDRSEPPAGAVASCEVDESLVISQVGGGLQAAVGSCTGGCRTLEHLTGSNQSGVVEMSGTYQGNLSGQPEQVSYSLKFNPKTQHLVGTRNGQPFWAAPLVTGPQAGCSPSPLPGSG